MVWKERRGVEVVYGNLPNAIKLVHGQNQWPLTGNEKRRQC